MLDNKYMIIDDLSPPERIIPFMKIEDNINNEDDDQSDIANGIEFWGKLVFPESGTESQSQRDLDLEEIDGEDYEEVPNTGFCG